MNAAYEQREAAADAHTAYNPWRPMTDPRDLKTMGKLLEELGELTAAASRCLIQGIDEVEPITGKSNHLWLSEELADVMANAALVCERFSVDLDFIQDRSESKIVRLRGWHEQA